MTMTELQQLSFEEWVDLADRYLRELLPGKPDLHQGAKSASWGFQSQLADVRLDESGRVMPRFLWHAGALSGMQIGELREIHELELRPADAKRFAGLAKDFFYGDRDFIRTLKVRKPA
jgi:hypothetical protein